MEAIQGPKLVPESKNAEKLRFRRLFSHKKVPNSSYLHLHSVFSSEIVYIFIRSLAMTVTIKSNFQICAQIDEQGHLRDMNGCGIYYECSYRENI